MSKKEGFFAVDRHAWARVCDLGINQAIAYLIMARGTGGDNRTTAWSVNVIETRTAISRPRAKMAIQSLEKEGLIQVLARGTKPRYWIVPAFSVPGSSCYLSSEDRKLLDEAEAAPLSFGRTRAADKTRADRLVKLGCLEVADGAYSLVEGHEIRPEWIWLPNALADGLNGETAPVEILRQSSSIDAIRMFGNLYAEHDLRDDAGIPWRGSEGIYQLYEREELNRRGEFCIWGFPTYEGRANAKLYAAQQHWKVRGSWKGFWDAAAVLQNAGLLQFVAHLVTSHDEQGEVLHPLPIGGTGEPIERRLTAEADRAAAALVKPGTDLNRYWAVVPVRLHVAGVQLVGIGRLRYRPQTEATAAWLRKGAEWQKWADAYARIADDALGIPRREQAVATSR